MNAKELADRTVKDIAARRERKEKMLADVQLKSIDRCMKRSAYCATRQYNRRIGQI